MTLRSRSLNCRCLCSRCICSVRFLSAISCGTICIALYLLLVKNTHVPESLISANGISGLLDDNILKYAVETSQCQIPEINPWDPSILNFLEPDRGFPIDCRASHRSWTRIDGTELVLNLTAIHESGYSMTSIRCCYRTIERVEQPLSDYDINADNYVKYSDKCHSLKKERQKIDADFIRVHCVATTPPLLDDVVYRDFFAIPQSESDRLVAKKITEWNSKTKNPDNNTTPPNIVIVGIDNNSRMNSHRNLKKTLEQLRKMGAVELLGYTKVGENTFPNTVAFISGYSEAELMPICYNTNADPQDDCPYVWKAFDSAGYLTVAAEDTPYVGGFNYLKTGFLRKPCDFYLRPLMLAVLTYMPRADYYHTDCIGSYMTEEVVFNYILEIIKRVSGKAPVFVHSWLTSLAHHNYNNIRFGDDSISTFIQSLGETTNTIFFFMSDHGQRFGPIRETSQGWYEDKLPTQWVYIPPKLREQFPDWHSSLQENAKKLTSHYDVYKTILHVLKTYDLENKAEEYYNRSISQKGQSLFQPVMENRSCDEAGISVNLCACSKPEPISVDDDQVKAAAESALTYLTNSLPLDVCAKPTLGRIVRAGYIRVPSRPIYVITMVTNPGDFLFEVNVEKEHDKFVIRTDLLRMNKITRPANCVSTNLLERYCYCL
ncbi:30S ribosomal protein S4 [Orchesella cincta]|uniref:30S ribosomal protein S4 n=1 Tax=Orchesella cincta TaxID=48709 RepID=A0A1D2MAN5_ORCCI|nr:30S ribosomal protein S4 [Orchesella cincta]